MTGFHLVIPVHLAGTLAANQQGAFTLPCAASLKEVQAVGSNANDATIRLGTVADDDGYLTASPIGDSSVPARLTSFTGALVPAGYTQPHFDAGAALTWMLDFDGAAGAAAANVSLQFIFVEG